ncbi:MAG: TIGR02921 family PEP-CTERM protein, partial [Deltaproteobacteria bacterium]|nr:TIGR02921 family PEP-CTERM protein [Deltaproteobacteria bacterium]
VHALSLSALVLVFNTFLFFSLSSQNHAQVLESLKNFDESSPEAKQAFIEDAPKIRKQLLNIYLAPYRYLGEFDRVNVMKVIYEESFDLDLKQDFWVQRIFNQVARPLLYVGSGEGMIQDQHLARNLYEEFFDGEIQELEREAIRHAVQATYSREQREAGLINIGEEKVFLEKQSLDLKEHGYWAELTLNEVYFNPGHQQEEVFYHFKLPEGAVLTGLWLSETPKKTHAFQVATRGAAQRVYKSVVRQRQDPALLEQVGPRLYRLRVFPIFPNAWETKQNRKMYLWMNVQLLKSAEGDWNLPILTEKRNVYWNDKTEFLLNGEVVKKSASWMPEHLASSVHEEAKSFKISLANHTLIASPAPDLETSLKSNVAVVIDSSFSMFSHQEKLEEALAAWRILNIKPKHLDFFVAGSKQDKVLKLASPHLDPSDFFGNLSLKDFLQEISSIQDQYDHIVFLTDKSLFRENLKNFEVAFKKPLWFYMVDGAYPRSLRDDFLDQLYTQGGSLVTSHEEVLREIAKYEALRKTLKLLALEGAYAWSLGEQTDLASEFESKALAAQVWIKHQIKEGAYKTKEELESIHALAKEAKIVTPYSSMIVLVNETQKKMLEEAENSKDRFKREVETGREILTNPQSPFEVTAVPEPEEWALILVAFILILFHFYKKGYRFNFSGIKF